MNTVQHTACTVAVAAGAAWGQQIVDPGVLPGTDRTSAAGVSADGLFVVGACSTAASQGGRAFRWSAATGMQDLGLIPGATSAGAAGVSADGSAVTGTCAPVGGKNVAFRWTAAGGMVDLTSSFGSWHAMGTAISGDGLTVAGRFIPAEGLAFRWTPTQGVQLLGVLANDSDAFGISGDGSVIVGVSAMWSRAFRWTASGGMQDLVPGGFPGVAQGANADGSVIVGWGSPAARFRWTSAGGIESLPLVPGSSGWPRTP
jgi:probable HAF family extracellular repeat protein